MIAMCTLQCPYVVQGWEGVTISPNLTRSRYLGKSTTILATKCSLTYRPWASSSLELHWSFSRNYHYPVLHSTWSKKAWADSLQMVLQWPLCTLNNAIMDTADFLSAVRQILSWWSSTLSFSGKKSVHRLVFVWSLLHLINTVYRMQWAQQTVTVNWYLPYHWTVATVHMVQSSYIN